MKSLACLFILTIILSAVSAAEDKKPALIGEFLAITDARGTLEKLRLDNVAQTRNLLFQQAGEQAKNPLMLRLLNRAMEKYADYSKEIFDWSKWEKKYSTLYSDLFSEAELEGIVSFYNSGAGRAMTRAQPEIGKRMQEQMFAGASAGNERIDQIMKETIAEIQEEVRKEEANQPAQTTAGR